MRGSSFEVATGVSTSKDVQVFNVILMFYFKQSNCDVQAYMYIHQD